MVRLPPSMIRGARGALNWSIIALADAAGLSVSTVKRMEMDGTQPVSLQAYAQVRAAFEASNVRFLAENGAIVGLRFGCPKAEKPIGANSLFRQ